MKTNATFLTLALGLAALLRVSDAQAVTLVKDGAPGAVLIVEAGAEKSMQAAEALQLYIEKMKGGRRTIPPRLHICTGGGGVRPDVSRFELSLLIIQL